MLALPEAVLLEEGTGPPLAEAEPVADALALPEAEPVADVPALAEAEPVADVLALPEAEPVAVLVGPVTGPLATPLRSSTALSGSLRLELPT